MRPPDVECLPPKELNIRNARSCKRLRRVLTKPALALGKLRGPLFCSYYFVVCNLKKQIQLAPDFRQHERVYHPLCTFGAPSTADIEESLNDTDRFGGCLLFQDCEAADALNESHLNVKQIVVIACPPPALLSDNALRSQDLQDKILLHSLVRIVFRDCDELTELPSNLGRCEALRTLVVHRCSNLGTFGLCHEALHHLVLLSCPQLKDTLRIATLPTLRLCVARQCSRLTIEVDSRHDKLLQLVVSQIYRLQPDPEQPDPEQPGPEQPDPKQPDPEQPDPKQPDPEQPDPEQPDPEQPDPEQPAGGPKLPDPGFMPNTKIQMPSSLVKFSYEHTNSLCPAITQPQQQQQQRLQNLSFFRYTLFRVLPTNIAWNRLERLIIVGCTSIDQEDFVNRVLGQLTCLKQLRASLAFDQV